jgi:hypothetical protein
MWDLETMGIRPNSIVLSVGLVIFDPLTFEKIAEFYSPISREDCEFFGLVTDQSTIDWWNREKIRNPEAAKVIDAAESKDAPCIIDVLIQIDELFAKHKVSTVWGNGSDFDNVLMTNLYHAVDRPRPWEFFRNRCYRTIKSIFDGVKIQKHGIQHNALADAIQQFEHLAAICKGYGIIIK